MIQRHKISRLSLLLLLWFCTMNAVAQNITVSGTVTDEQTKEPLIGVTIRQQDSSNGTTTDLDGNYKISVPRNATLSFSYMGYKAQTQAVQGRSNIDILLQSDAIGLNELVVIGYGVQKKSDITGSISSIAGKDINNTPVSSTLQALQGRAAGVNIIQNSGAPGGGTTIKIRGTGTINDADPLYVVDGFIVDNIDYLNPNDIQNVEVFKDAASSAVYGARAANGVVSIITKSGKSGKTRVTYDGYVGFSNPWKKIEVMDAENYALMQDYINGTSTYSADGQLYMTKNEDGSYSYDPAKYAILDTLRNNSAGNWWDAITRTGFKMQHGVSVSGGSDKTQFLASASYYNEDGIVETSDYNRFNGRLNVNTELASWLKLTTNMAYTNEKRKGVPEGSSSILKQALYESPMQYLYDNKGYWYSANPIANLERDNEKMERERLDMNLSLDAQICKLLTYQFKVSYYSVHRTDDNFFEVWGLDEDFVMPSSLTTVDKFQRHIRKWEINNLLTFMWENDHHSLTILAGQTAEGYKNSWHHSRRSGTPSNEDHYHYLSSAYTGDKAYGLDRDWTSIGLIGRINYSYNDTYLFQANVRADGSSMFAKGNRWGVFPSVSLGWKFSNEKFMKSFSSWLNNGKLRVGWGLLGNNRIDELSRYTVINSGYNYPFGLGNSTIYEGATATVLGNDNIKWEKNRSWNIGADFSLFDFRLTFTAEYFNRKTTDMLLRVPTVASAGLDQSPMTNAGSVKNYGWEFDAKWRDRIGKDWRYEVGFNLSWIKNKVTGLGTGNEPVYGSYLSEGSIVDFVTKTAVGQPIGSFFGYVTDGIFQNYEEVRKSAQYEIGKNDFEQTFMPGDFRFKDLNGDNKITAEDRTYLGSPLPKFVFGIPMALGYKDFDLNIFFQGQTGNKVFNVMDYYLYNGAVGNVYADIRSKHWSGQLEEQARTFFPLNTNTNIPDLANNDAPRNFRASDFFVKDGSYLRLKQVQLVYNFSQALLSKWRINTLALSLTAYNLVTFTNYDGFDPEVGKVVGSEGNNLSMGVDQGNYPQARAFTFGVKLGL
ncbi:MAG: SusC/RagA family TonB-linked outer membrane protein [Prevotella sp.]|jgi:TonB-linked SusC/RagA family outer membrane protein